MHEYSVSYVWVKAEIELWSGRFLLFISWLQKYSLQGTTQGNGLTGGVPPVRFSM